MMQFGKARPVKAGTSPNAFGKGQHIGQQAVSSAVVGEASLRNLTPEEREIFLALGGEIEQLDAEESKVAQAARPAPQLNNSQSGSGLRLQAPGKGRLVATPTPALVAIQTPAMAVGSQSHLAKGQLGKGQLPGSSSEGVAQVHLNHQQQQQQQQLGKGQIGQLPLGRLHVLQAGTAGQLGKGQHSKQVAEPSAVPGLSLKGALRPISVPSLSFGQPGKVPQQPKKITLGIFDARANVARPEKGVVAPSNGSGALAGTGNRLLKVLQKPEGNVPKASGLGVQPNVQRPVSMALSHPPGSLQASASKVPKQPTGPPPARLLVLTGGPGTSPSPNPFGVSSFVRMPANMKSVVFFIDELGMQNRSDLGPSPTDVEVFADPLPDDADMSDWLQAFGAVEEVYRILDPDSGKPRDQGYVRFLTHDAAKSCVELGAGTWSESERALATQAAIKRSVVRAYPESIASAFLGKKGADINQLRMECGLRTIALKGEGLEKSGGDSSARTATLTPKRLHFYADGPPESIEKFQPALEKRLSEIYESIRKKVEDLGGLEAWRAEQGKEVEWIAERGNKQQMQDGTEHYKSSEGGRYESGDLQDERQRHPGAWVQPSQYGYHLGPHPGQLHGAHPGMLGPLRGHFLGPPPGPPPGPPLGHWVQPSSQWHSWGGQNDREKGARSRSRGGRMRSRSRGKDGKGGDRKRGGRKNKDKRDNRKDDKGGQQKGDSKAQKGDAKGGSKGKSEAGGNQNKSTAENPKRDRDNSDSSDDDWGGDWVVDKDDKTKERRLESTSQSKGPPRSLADQEQQASDDDWGDDWKTTGEPNDKKARWQQEEDDDPALLWAAQQEAEEQMRLRAEESGTKDAAGEEAGGEIRVEDESVMAMLPQTPPRVEEVIKRRTEEEEVD